MAGRDSWVEHQQRLVRCKIHGLHYDPKLTSGCTICRKLAQPKRRSPQLAIMLLLLLGIVFVLLQLLTPWLQPSETEAELPAQEQELAGTVESRAPGRPPRLDPERYRSAIETIEATLFQPQTSDPSQIADQLESAGSRLSQDLESSGGDLGTAAATSIESLVERWQGSLATVQDVERAKLQWLQSRDRFFEEAPWFNHLVSDSGQVDRRTLLAYREVAAEAETLLAEGHEQIQVRNDDDTTPAETPVESEAQSPARREWWSAWRRRVEELSGRLPARPGAQASAPLLAAVAQLEQALNRLRQLSADPNLADRPEAAQTLDDLSSEVATIVRDFDDLLSA